jgi:aryl-alcohol dehydrogenase-like predicted oxidoreductase
MSSIDQAGTYQLGDRQVRRLGYGAMQLAGPGVFGPPKDRDAALAVLRETRALGIDHIDTSDFYGPHITNQLIREALHPYPDELVIVTKIGARRDAQGAWLPAFSAKELEQAVHDNLRNLGREVLDVVNFRSMLDVHGPAEGSLEAPLTALAELRERGLVRHIGLSNVTMRQVEEAHSILPVACVQNMYNLVRLQADALSAVAQQLEATPMQVAIAWLLRRAPNILLIPGTSSVTHLRENVAAGGLVLPDEAMAALDGIGCAVEEKTEA